MGRVGLGVRTRVGTACGVAELVRMRSEAVWNTIAGVSQATLPRRAALPDKFAQHGDAPLLLALFHLARFLVALELLIVEHMVDAEGAAEDGRAVKVVDSEDGRALVGVHEPGEAAGLARVGIAREVDVDDLAVPVRESW